MTSSDSDKSRIRYAKLAGLMYLLVDATYLTSVLVTTRFRVPGDFAQTADRIARAELLYRIGLSSGLVASVCVVFLAIGLYVAVKPLDGNLALLALLFRLLEATFVGGQAIFGFIVLKLYVGSDSLKAFDGQQLSVFMTLHAVADAVVFNGFAIFFGIGSTLFFYLLFQSVYVPKFLAGLGLFGSVLVPMVCLGSLVWPLHAKMLQLGWAPIGLAEVIVGIWLLFTSASLQVSRPARPLPQ